MRRVAPALGYRAHIREPDLETLRALRVQHGRILYDYASSVITPILAQQPFGGRSVRRLRRALANGGRWQDPSTHSELAALVRERRYLTEVCDCRNRLAGMTARDRADISVLAQDLRRWCTDAETSGIRVLVEFAKRLKGCHVVK